MSSKRIQRKGSDKYLTFCCYDWGCRVVFGANIDVDVVDSNGEIMKLYILYFNLLVYLLGMHWKAQARKVCSA